MHLETKNIPSKTVLSQTLDYLQSVFKQRLFTHFGEDDVVFNFDTLEMPQIKDDGSAFSKFLVKTRPNSTEYLAISLALIPHLLPGFLSRIIMESLSQSGGFAELGGVKGENNRGFLPTGETLLFLVAGEDLEKRREVQELFSTSHWFHKKGLLYLERVKLGHPKSSGRLVMDAEYVELFTTGKISPPAMSTDFPAQHLSTEMDWDDLVLSTKTHDQLEEIKIWIEHNDTLLNDWGMASKIKPGYRALFHGPSGTGKTLTATLLGKHTRKEVFRIDLSTVVSKFIGETEKNLATLFDKAENKNWILFFDEADALFGKRTNVRDAHDKYANQEVSYLLQRIESFSGLVILASNFKSNIDNAFVRRFQSIIYFPIPNATERYQLWLKAFPKNIDFEKSINLKNIAHKYELTGANIINIVQYTCLQALSRNTMLITLKDLQTGIKKEFLKEGK